MKTEPDYFDDDLDYYPQLCPFCSIGFMEDGCCNDCGYEEKTNGGQKQ